MADCKFVIHARGTEEALAELTARMSDWHHSPRVHRPCPLTLTDLGDEKADETVDGKSLRSVAMEGLCSFSVEGSFCTDEQTTYIRSFGWGGTIGSYSEKIDGEITLEVTAQELGIDIEGYSFHPDDETRIWEHIWYSGDGTTSVMEDSDEVLDDWGNVVQEQIVIPAVWHF